MANCQTLIHPFQHDPGVSQRQRVMKELLTDAPKIDGRSLADLLDYFVQLSGSINYYDENLQTSDWKAFFNDSLPFQLAAMIKTDPAVLTEKFTCYDFLFRKNPSRSGLQLNLSYVYFHTIRKINLWYKQVKGSQLPIELLLAKLIKNKLQQPLKTFIGLYNAGVKYYCIRKIDFSGLAEIWGIKTTDLHALDNTFLQTGASNRKHLLELERELNDLFPLLAESFNVLTQAATEDLPASFKPAAEELKQKHSPHLALIFVFIQLFVKLQNDLNGFTKKHLDFFYQEVLRLTPKPATADRANILFELQNQLQKHLVAKGVLVKAGKDNNKSEILFSLDDDLVVNKTTVADTRTLYLNNHVVQETDYLEGVYIAPDATKADGIDKDFKDGQPANYPTLGAKNSKYIAPGTDFFKPYPGARLGFLLGSPVLLLNEGKRTVNITLACQLFDPTVVNLEKICKPDDDNGEYPGFYSTQAIFNKIKKLFRKYFVYVSMELINTAATKGISKDTIQLLKDNFLSDGTKTICGKAETVYVQENTVTWEKWWNSYYSVVNPAEKEVIDGLFKKRRVFKIAFSGAKEWITPSQIKRMRFTPLVVNGTKMTFAIKIKAVLKEDKPSITFYDREALLEDFNTTLPLVKIELDDLVKIKKGIDLDAGGCCLDRAVDNNKLPLSFYYFMRNLRIIDTTDTDPQGHTYSSGIEVKVCGLKNFVVQNDENVMDVNSPMYPFGTIPKINADFYIGSKEIFCKKWQKVIVNLFWKDKPMSLKDYYHGYEDTIFNIKSDDFLESRFRFNSAVLKDQVWFNNSAERQLFKTDFNRCCGDYPFISTACPDPNVMFDNDGWVKRTCVKYQFINTACILETKLNADGTIQAGSISGEVVLASAFKTAFIKTVGGVDYIDYCCIIEAPYSYIFSNADFGGLQTENKDAPFFNSEPFSVNAANGFLRLNLVGQDFQHNRYSYVLTRQMQAMGNFPMVYVGPVYDGINVTTTQVLQVLTFDDLFKAVEDSLKVTQSANPRLKAVLDAIRAAYPGGFPIGAPFNVSFDDALTRKALGDPYPGANINPAHVIADTDLPPLFADSDVDKLIKYLEDAILSPTKTKIDNVEKIRVVIPNAPYALQIKHITLDYTAQAGLNDIDLIHLYPYAGTYKHEEIQLQPTLFPTFCDEGTLFLGLLNLVPGENVNMLFQLAEATSDSESDPEDVHWHYLDANQWKPLRTGFEVLHDDTENLTSSGIIKFALPENMTSDNTIMPSGLYWIKASIPKNSGAVSETIGIFTQAIAVTFTDEEANDKLRLNTPLPAGSIAKLDVPDSGIKQLSQPFDSFGGAQPELQEHYYIRVSELLRHKGRAIQKFDYERLALEQFPELFKVKCINHSFALNAHRYSNDFPVAPGYVLLAVIPDLNILKAGNSFEPKVPVSILENIKEYFAKKTSPFARFRAMNPRYEKVSFSISVKLVPGKDKNFFKEQLAEDIRTFMAPWAVGDYYKLTFGQCVNRSQIIQFIESKEYVDHILELKMYNEETGKSSCEEPFEICPVTPRSILVAGEIDVCITDTECEDWARQSCANLPVPIKEYCKK